MPGLFLRLLRRLRELCLSLIETTERDQGPWLPAESGCGRVKSEGAACCPSIDLLPEPPRWIAEPSLRLSPTPREDARRAPILQVKVDWRPGRILPAAGIGRRAGTRLTGNGFALQFTVSYIVVGAVFIIMALSGSVLKRLPLSTSMLYLAAGVLIGPHALNLINSDPIAEAEIVERITEVAVIVSLFTAGLKLRVPLRDPLWRLPSCSPPGRWRSRSVSSRSSRSSSSSCR